MAAVGTNNLLNRAGPAGEITDGNWEYNAPQFFDFTRVADEDVDDCEDYFSFDHESDFGSRLPSCYSADEHLGSAENKPVPVAVHACLKNDTSVVSLSETGKMQNVAAGTLVIANNQITELEQQFSHMLLNSTGMNAENAGLQKNNPVPRIEDAAKVHTPLREINRASLQATPQPANNEYQKERGRVRCVDIVTSAKKRLSMSVDRGQAKLAKMASALVGHSQKVLFAIPGSPGVLHSTLHCMAHGEAEPLPMELPKGSSLALTSTASLAEVLDAEDVVARLIHGNAQAIEAERGNHGVIPHVGIPFKPIGLLEKRRTTVKPFSFEERNRRAMELKQEKIKKIIEAEKKLREFHAQPFPEIIYSSVSKNTQAVQKKAKDKPEPELKRSASFKAKPPTVLHREPFVPHRSMRPLTGTMAIPPSLNTKRRAEQRAEWEKWRREKELEEKQEREQREQERAEAETKRLRKLTVHRALPLPNFIKRATNRDAAAVECKSGTPDPTV